jgi:recombination associated protein RdgC
MWLKNARVYRFTETPTALELWEEKLQRAQFSPLEPGETERAGWIPPVPGLYGLLRPVGDGLYALRWQSAAKMLPADVLKELLEERVAELQAREPERTIGKSRRNQIKDEIFHDLLPQAFVRYRRVLAYVDVVGGWLVVDAASSKVADAVQHLLRKSLGELPVVPLGSSKEPLFAQFQQPEKEYTRWVLHEPPEGVSLGNAAVLTDGEAATLRAKGANLGDEDLLHLIRDGMDVAQIQITYNERLTCVLDQELAIKGLRWGDVVTAERAGIEAEGDGGQFDADLVLQGLEIRRFLEALMGWFGVGAQP